MVQKQKLYFKALIVNLSIPDFYRVNYLNFVHRFEKFHLKICYIENDL